MSSAPATPRTPKVVQRVVPEKTILNFDSNETYVEDDDDTFMHQSSMILEYLDVLEDTTPDDTIQDELLNLLTEESTVEVPAESNTKEEPVADEKPALESIILAQTSEFRKFLVKHEVVRKLLHSSIGVFTLWLYTLGVHQTQIILPLATLFAVIFTNDYIRFQNPELNRKVVNTMWFLIREKEVNQYNGTLWYLVGLMIVFALFPKDISLMSVLLLSWADVSASTIGRQFGKYTPQITAGKSVAGSLASFVTGVFSCYLLYGYFIPNYNVNEPKDILWSESTSQLNFHVYALLSGFIASASEFINLWNIDDNFTIPVLSGFFLYGVAKAFEV
ncbi:uncharacterized protein CANTADRAFT_88384 [Suhomyces tanzawaensis NRRL Y-17324]|uniref:CTP-dependent diacylglycerol kinase 1 n=1 Tax=Suhomyces tanzawaensis NRRL Y-17324 TaxID=984487 RepID=A0A1E4SM12_9ASCO|nr:uncharacterized protein CANTADRAFT_88384 [Suhomyces tanzawaensis NRRL Y-17324]ODV80447.1 hypothetical protein CANTADRAFT_88384 [Suhomyces tanzawaensis NRRL Y-17324]